MKVALISDIHLARYALTECLADIAKEEVDEIWCLGDIIGGLCVDTPALVRLVKDSCTLCIQGNHDRNDLAHHGLMGTAEGQWIQELPRMQMHESVGLWHGSPFTAPDAHTDHYVFDSDGAYQALSGLDKYPHIKVILHGHTHLAQAWGEINGHVQKITPDTCGGSFSLMPYERIIICPGSVGEPRRQEVDNDVGVAEWGILEFDEDVATEFTWKQTFYDREIAEQEIDPVWRQTVRDLELRGIKFID